MNDDDVIIRLRSALDETTATVGDGEMPLVATTGPAPQPGRGRWLAVAAAAVLVAGGVAAIAANRGDDSRQGDSTSTPLTTVADGSTTTTASPLPVGSPWYLLTADGLTAEQPITEACCPPMPAPGPTTTVAWASTDGIEDGLLLLVSAPTIGGEPVETFLFYGMTAERAAQLEAEVQPGSGLPYVLDDPSMTLIGSGFAEIGNRTTQRYTGATSAGDGTVTVSVGEYRGDLVPLGQGVEVSTLTIDGQPAYRYTLEGEHVVWRTAEGPWARVDIAGGLTARADEIVESIARVTPGDPTDTTVPTTLPTTTPSGDTVFMGNASGIIDSGDGPMIAFGFLDSYPPQGGNLPLAGFDWDMIDDETTANGTTWTESGVGLVGTWDGEVFTLTEPVQAPLTGLGDSPLTHDAVTPGCTDADVQPLLDALQALDTQALGIVAWGDDRWDGRCGVFVEAAFDTLAVHEAVSPLGDDVTVIPYFRAVEP